MTSLAPSVWKNTAARSGCTILASRTGASGCISRLDENPNDRDQQHGSEPDHDDLAVDGSVCGEHRPVHGSPPNETCLINAFCLAVGLIAAWLA
jgi:hypothetical protein